MLSPRPSRSRPPTALKRLRMAASYREKSTSHSQELKGCEIAALDLAIPRRWLWPQESGACVKFTPAGADVFA